MKDIIKSIVLGIYGIAILGCLVIICMCLWKMTSETKTEEKILDPDVAVSENCTVTIEHLVIKEVEVIKEAEEEETEEETETTDEYSWDGSVLTANGGVNAGPSGKETYYNLPMGGVVQIMRNMGNNDEYWIREDGVKMLGEYVMVAADLSLHPRGSLVLTSLGMGIVCDTGEFIYTTPTQLDIAVDW